MLYGRTGVNLEIDLSKGNIEKEEFESQLSEAYLGGRGVCTKILWDRVSPEVAPFSNHNLLIFGAGLLTGTLAPGANRTVLVTRSPQTDLLTYSLMGGFWAPELKHAGYDNVIISGRSSSPVYLWINNDKVEIRDAQHLWGKDVEEAQQIIKNELKNDKVQILCIGQAGENRVYCASIEHSSGASFSRAGVGALMGDKKLKAIAVCGTKDAYIAQPSKFYELCENVLKKTERLRAFVDNWSYEREDLIKVAQYGNLEEFRAMENIGSRHEAFLREFRQRQISCHLCPLRCKHAIRLRKNAYSFIKCVPWYSFIACCKLQDFSFSVECYNLCEKYGLDALSAPYLIAFAIDLYEKGILTEADTEGLHLEWGNGDLVFTLIGKIARREGIGGVLANGVYEAARQIGRGAEKYAFHVKKVEIPPIPLNHPYSNLVHCVSDRADLFKMISAVPQHYFKKSKAEKKEYTESEYWPYPEEFKKLIWDDYDPTGADYDRVTKMVSFDNESSCMSDITGICRFWTGFWPFNPYLFDDQVKLISYSTGMDIDEKEGMKIAKKINALTRAYNVRLGISRKDDRPPKRHFFQATVPPVLPPLDRSIFDRTIDSYYKLRGYDKDGMPTKKTLDELDLGYVRQDLVKRGILPDENKKNTG